MKDYYNLIVDLALQTCLMDDYGDRIKCIKHDKARTRILKLQKEMAAMDQNWSEIVTKLLNHTDDRVKLEGAVCCMKFSTHKLETIRTLNAIKSFSHDGTLRYAAEKLLEQINKDE